MSSPQQIEANRQNAQLSTGPRTEEGKQKSSSNSIKHGLCATSIAAFAPELREQFVAFREALEAEFGPASNNEQLMFEHYAFAQFLYIRAQAMEANAQDAHMANPKDALLEARFLRASRYVRSKINAAKSALKELRTFQADRLLAAEIQDHMLVVENEANYKLPIATPLHKVFVAKDLVTNKRDGTLRLLYAADATNKLAAAA